MISIDHIYVIFTYPTSIDFMIVQEYNDTKLYFERYFWIHKHQGRDGL